MKQFLNSCGVYDKLMWKCDMSTIEIKETYNNMAEWLFLNVDLENYHWYNPAHETRDVGVEGTSICFRYPETLVQFVERFGVIK